VEDVFVAVVGSTGPLASVEHCTIPDDESGIVGGAPLGLQCGIHAKSLETALAATRGLHIGAVMIDGTSTWRSDQLPCRGLKISRIGREGPRRHLRTDGGATGRPQTLKADPQWSAAQP
jgi:acyl-CoA reductase-like NAD-dependent aldehyde dehydrogenase